MGLLSPPPHPPPLRGCSPPPPPRPQTGIPRGGRRGNDPSTAALALSSRPPRAPTLRPAASGDRFAPARGHFSSIRPWQRLNGARRGRVPAAPPRAAPGLPRPPGARRWQPGHSCPPGSRGHNWPSVRSPQVGQGPGTPARRRWCCPRQQAPEAPLRTRRRDDRGPSPRRGSSQSLETGEGAAEKAMPPALRCALRPGQGASPVPLAAARMNPFCNLHAQQ